jgi:hypothetical protein
MLTRSQHAASRKRAGKSKVDYNKTNKCPKTCQLLLVRPYIPEHCTTRTHTNKRKTRQQTAPPKSWNNSHPALVASRLRESSLSPCERTCPQSANEVYVFNARPVASTSMTLIWTDAWSLEVIRRSATHAHWIVSEHSSLAKHLLVAAHLRGT